MSFYTKVIFVAILMAALYFLVWKPIDKMMSEKTELVFGVAKIEEQI